MRRIAKILGLFAVTALALSSCMLLESAGIESRIAMFESGLNDEDRSTLYLNFSPTETEQYDNMTDQTYWVTTPLAYANKGDGFVIAVVDASDPENVQATITTANLTEHPISFVMVRDGFGWLIHELVLATDSTTFTIKRP